MVNWIGKPMSNYMCLIVGVSCDQCLHSGQ